MLRRAINSDINEYHYTKQRSKQHHCAISKQATRDKEAMNSIQIDILFQEAYRHKSF